MMKLQVMLSLSGPALGSQKPSTSATPTVGTGVWTISSENGSILLPTSGSAVIAGSSRFVSSGVALHFQSDRHSVSAS